jgi:hypothetical protein
MSKKTDDLKGHIYRHVPRRRRSWHRGRGHGSGCQPRRQDLRLWGVWWGGPPGPPTPPPAEVLPRQFLPWFGFLPIHAKKNCADVLYLGANNNDAEPKIYFLNEIVK